MRYKHYFKGKYIFFSNGLPHRNISRQRYKAKIRTFGTTFMFPYLFMLFVSVISYFQVKQGLEIYMKKYLSVIRKYHNHILQTDPQHREKSHRTVIVTIHMQGNNSKATSFTFNQRSHLANSSHEIQSVNPFFHLYLC